MKTTLTLLALAGAVLAQGGPQGGGPPQSDINPEAAGIETPDEIFANNLQELCFPWDQETGEPYYDAPCNAARNIMIECTYGPDVNFTNSETGDWDEDGPAQLSNTTQQACVCQSQFWDQQWGCQQCYTKHGDTDFAPELTDKVYSSLSSSYCAASSTPTLGFADWLAYAGESVLSTISTPPATATAYTDPIGNKTEVSLYFTASVTGSAAWNAVTGGSVRTLDGQIVPTASADRTMTTSASGDVKAQSTGPATSHSSTSTGLAPIVTPQAMAAAAGVLGFAGLVALL